MVRLSTLGRVAAAATLVLGAGFQLAAFVTEPSSDTTFERFRWIAANPDRADLAKVFDILAMPFLFGTIVVYVLLARERSPRLTYLGAGLLTCGMVGLSILQGFEALAFELVHVRRIDLIGLAGAVDGASSPPLAAMFALFLPGAFLGLSVMTVALWRSRVVPRGAVLLIPAFLVVDIILQQGLVGHAISLVEACWIGSVILATRSQLGRVVISPKP